MLSLPCSGLASCQFDLRMRIMLTTNIIQRWLFCVLSDIYISICFQFRSHKQRTRLRLVCYFWLLNRKHCIFQHDKACTFQSGVFANSLFSKLLCDSAVRRKYLLLITNSFVLDHPSIKWCPAPGCDNAVLASNIDNNPVHCSCGPSFW